VHIGSKDHNLYAINADGTKKWAVATGSVAMYSSPAIASDSTIYVGSWDHTSTRSITMEKRSGRSQLGASSSPKPGSIEVLMMKSGVCAIFKRTS
jgi:outer membrane protein assembly factor BamB